MAGASQLQSPAKPDGVVQDILFGTSMATQANTPEESEVVRLVMGMLAKGKAWKATWSKNHDRWWNLWESNHYYDQSSHTLTRAIVNQLWGELETFVAHVTESLPEPICRARTPENKAKAKTISKWLTYEADRNDLGQEMEHPVRSACVTGAGWYAVEWDEKADRGRGGCWLRPRDEKFIFTSPNARNLKECLWLIDGSNVPREFVLKTWPAKGQLVPPGIMDVSLENLRTYTENSMTGAQSPTFLQATTTDGSNSSWTGSQGGLGLKKSDMVTLLKCYIRQDDGAMRLVVLSNGVLLQDGPSPYEDDDFPYVVINILPTLDTIQGRGLVQFIEGLQVILNNSISYLLDQQRFVADPMLRVSSANLEDGQLIDNSPGAVLPDSDPNGHGYEWLQAPGFNQGWLQIQEMVKDYMDSVLGRVEILQGENPTGVSTLGGLEVLRDEANIRLRKHIKWVKASLKRMYLLTLSRLRQFAKDERMIRLTDSMGREEFVEINKVQGVSLEGGSMVDQTIPEDAEFDIEFGKEMPGGRQARIEMALAFAGTPAEDGLPMVDRQWVLEQAEIEEAPEIMARLNQMAQQQMQAEQAAAQNPQAAAGAAGDPLDEMAALLSGAAA